MCQLAPTATTWRRPPPTFCRYIAKRASRGLRSLGVGQSSDGGATWQLVGLIRWVGGQTWGLQLTAAAHVCY
jgi:hypothetical protein